MCISRVRDSRGRSGRLVARIQMGMQALCNSHLTGVHWSSCCVPLTRPEQSTEAYRMGIQATQPSPSPSHWIRHGTRDAGAPHRLYRCPQLGRYSCFPRDSIATQHLPPSSPLVFPRSILSSAASSPVFALSQGHKGPPNLADPHCDTKAHSSLPLTTPTPSCRPRPISSRRQPPRKGRGESSTGPLTQPLAEKCGLRGRLQHRRGRVPPRRRGGLSPALLAGLVAPLPPAPDEQGPQRRGGGRRAGRARLA